VVYRETAKIVAQKKRGGGRPSEKKKEDDVAGTLKTAELGSGSHKRESRCRGKEKERNANPKLHETPRGSVPS